MAVNEMIHTDQQFNGTQDSALSGFRDGYGQDGAGMGTGDQEELQPPIHGGQPGAEVELDFVPNS